MAISMISKRTRNDLLGISEELAMLLKAKMSLEAIEETIIESLVNIINADISIISGFNRTGRNSKNIINENKYNEYTAVINIIDGHQNYFRGLNLYGYSISIICIASGDIFSIVYDSINNELFSTADKKLNYKSNNTLYCNKRMVLSIGKIFPMSNASINLLQNASLRSFGSTTMTILAALRNEIDFYLNRTKLWNILWAFGFCKASGLVIEDIENNRDMSSCFMSYISEPEKSILIACYSDRALRDKMHHVVGDFKRAFY